MDVLQSHLEKIKIPSEQDKVYKDECVYSFDNPETETGLYVSLTSFIGLGKEYVDCHSQRTKEYVYLCIHRERHEISSPPQRDGPEKKITRLAIGVEGGFDSESGKKRFEFQETYKVVVLPSYTTFDWPKESLPDIVRLSVQTILDLPSASKLAELEALSGTWDGETRQVSKHAQNLVQLDNGKKIPPTGWQCERCDKTENLWLNLTDGSVLCGRKFFDGSGGNNHALEHFCETSHPLAVKLGTITKEGKADVFSYAEDDMVEDPLLAQHLQHWGINVSQMEKTEKSMVELELELNKKNNEWSTLCESERKLKPICGPAYTGMQNMGNSCYLNSVMQVLFSIPDFIRRYYDGSAEIFKQPTNTPAEDFNIQMAKLAVGLLSGKYSVPPPPGSPVDADPPGITPRMFKTLVGKGHPEFSTKKQQDVQEFLLHMLTLLERHNKNVDPGKCFKFEVEERFQCGQSKKVKYLTRSDVCLSLNIPMDAAKNKDSVAAYEARKQEAEAQGKKLDPDSIVRPIISFLSCLESFGQSETINNFFSSAVNSNVTARKRTRLTSFPDYLVIQLKKFTLREDWVPIKLDVLVEMPDVIDISVLRGSGLQPGEELLPELESRPPSPQFDESVLLQLQDMGFPLQSCKRALYQTGNSGAEAATAWIMEHIGDPDFSDPFVPPGTQSTARDFEPNSEALETIISMGFSRKQATKALKKTENSLERAMDWIFSHTEDMDNEEATDDQRSNESKRSKFTDGRGNYKLIAFISHMGTATMVGHYVTHILKDGQWVIFNDSKVALSENPPKDLGYLYFYERI